MIERTPVSSSMIRSMGYDHETRSLELEFSKNGVVWVYSEFPPEEYEALQSADSVGKFFLARIKGRYPETKI